MTPIYFTSDKFPNCHIEFDGSGVILKISLNIEPEMKKFLCPQNVFKGEKMYVYSIKKRVELPTLKGMETTYNHLMAKAMINCRIAKNSVNNSEILNLINQL
jgi:hypothetical protein